jgi:flagellar assembly protein FliH
MTSSFSATRVTPAEARALTATRFDSELRLIPVDLVPDSDSKDGQLSTEELPSDFTAESASSATARGFDAGFDAGFATGTKNGHEAGFAAGYSEGREEMIAEVRAELLVEHTAIMLEHAELKNKLDLALRTMASGLSSIESATIPVYTEVGKDLGNVVVELVEELLGAELSADKAHVINSISIAVAEIPGHSEVRVSLHPDDLELVQSLDIDFDETLQRPVRLLADDSVEIHGAVVTSGCTRVDSQISQRIDQLKEALST